MRKKISVQKESSSVGKKILTGFGILLIVFGVMLCSFALSFQVMIEAANPDKSGDSLEAENAKLKQQVQILNDQITVLQNQANTASMSATGNGTSSSTGSSTTSSAGNSSKSSAGNSSGSSSGSSSKASSRSSSDDD